MLKLVSILIFANWCCIPYPVLRLISPLLCTLLLLVCGKNIQNLYEYRIINLGLYLWMESNALQEVILVLFWNQAGFGLACRLPHGRFAAWSSLAVSELQLSATTLLWSFHRVASLQSWIEINCLRSAAVGKAARGYWLIGLMLIIAWSSLCGKWCLCSWTNINIKVAMQWAASYSESSIKIQDSRIYSNIINIHTSKYNLHQKT